MGIPNNTGSSAPPLLVPVSFVESCLIVGSVKTLSLLVDWRWGVDTFNPCSEYSCNSTTRVRELRGIQILLQTHKPYICTYTSRYDQKDIFFHNDADQCTGCDS